MSKHQLYCGSLRRLRREHGPWASLLWWSFECWKLSWTPPAYQRCPPAPWTYLHSWADLWPCSDFYSCCCYSRRSSDLVCRTKSLLLCHRSFAHCLASCVTIVCCKTCELKCSVLTRVVSLVSLASGQSEIPFGSLSSGFCCKVFQSPITSCERTGTTSTICFMQLLQSSLPSLQSCLSWSCPRFQCLCQHSFSLGLPYLSLCLNWPEHRSSSRFAICPFDFVYQSQAHFKAGCESCWWRLVCE